LPWRPGLPRILPRCPKRRPWQRHVGPGRTVPWSRGSCAQRGTKRPPRARQACWPTRSISSASSRTG
jgi:hypothetical protein